jgi:hypothetical protein
MKYALILAVAGTIGTAFGFAVSPGATWFAWLFAWSAVLSTVMGTLIFLLICHAMSAVWPTAIRRLLEATIAVLPLLFVAFLPLLFGLDHLYPFTHLPHDHKRAWLNKPFFIGRSLGYLGVWCALAEVIRARSRDKAVLKALSAASLPLVGLTLTFASFDWVMALSPDWFSTIFGVYYFAGGFIGALALVPILIAAARAHFTRLGRSHFYALGRLLLAFTIFWAYIAYFQFFIIWIANKPVEARWYLDRVAGGFRAESWLLGIGHFAVPFFILLSYQVKQRLSRLLPVAVWILVFHVVDSHWLIAPARRSFSVFDLTALAALAGWTVAFALWRQRGIALLPVGDPDLEAALAYESR